MPKQETMDVDQFRNNEGLPTKHNENAKARKKRRKAGEPSPLELKFLHAIQGLPVPTREHRFHPVRKWRFDFAFISQRVAVEVQGGSWVNGAHNRAGHQKSDMEKLNEAQILGWLVLQFNTVHLKDLADVRMAVERALESRKGCSK